MGKLVMGPYRAVAHIFSVAVVVWIMGTIVWGGHTRMTWAFLTQAPKEGMTEGGIFPAIVGTFFLVVIMSLIGVPVGTITAIYLSEYVDRQSKVAKVIRFAVNTLAGIPAIVFGLFGLGFFVQFTGGALDKVLSPGVLHWAQPNILWASLTMALVDAARSSLYPWKRRSRPFLAICASFARSWRHALGDDPQSGFTGQRGRHSHGGHSGGQPGRG